ncbi:protein LTO1 homolog isoform X4 [Eptesicus fuscus]|uniref:protein LTO1 homolog isoform X4 n=1 Tax=Eptesicus fuscus TaxID=29078 RepID=UPI002403DA9D|nr:protein LTO1 homolog isoform X4 [Eptesicus fuscus]
MAEGQDLFDAIVMADDRFRGEGYQEGYEEGSGLGIIEGRQHGTVYGAKIGSEIGCYQGFAFAWRCLLHSCATEKDRTRKSKPLPPAAREPAATLGRLHKSVTHRWTPARSVQPGGPLAPSAKGV